MKKYQKLVRDFIPEIIRSNDEEPKTRILKNDEYKKALLDKLLEEAKEVSKANQKEELVKEIGDVREVLLAIIDSYGLSETEIEDIRKERRNERGGFSEKIYLEDVAENH